MRTFCSPDTARGRPYPAACRALLLFLPLTATAQDEAAADAELPAISAPEAVATVPEPAPLQRAEAQIILNDLMRAEDYSGAVPIAERLLELALEQYGTRSVETGEALLELGNVQRRAGMTEEAELSFLNSVEVFRSADGQFSERIIDPTIGLGDTYFDDAQYVNAVTAYNEARTLQRRTYGLLTEEQISVMDRLTQSYQSMSLHEEADEQQRAALLLVERIYGSSDIETLEAIYRYGAWLRSVYRFEDERQQYERAIRIIRSEYDKEHPLLVKPYQQIGNSFRNQGFESPRGISALNSAVELLQNQEDANPLEVAAAIIAVGDWRTAFGPIGSGHEEYLEAWNLLGTTPEGLSVRDEVLRPRRAFAVYSQGMSVRGLAQNPTDPDAVDGSVLIEFEINPYGRAENVTVVDSDPPGFKDDAAARSIRMSRFRPRIEDGEFVYARRQGYLITFRYIPDDGD